MDYVEEVTPRGLHLKIMLNNWQFLAFDRKGKSIYVDREGRRLLHRVPLIIFVGKSFSVRKEYERDYSLLKVLNGFVVVPYRDVLNKITRYIFIPVDKKVDLMPARLLLVPDLAILVKTVEVELAPDHFIVDESITSNDEVVIKARFQVDEVIHAETANNYSLAKTARSPESADAEVNLNILSTNPVFLARIHLRSMELSKVNQLLLDFDLTALDTEYILKFIENVVDEGDTDAVGRRMGMLEELRDSFRFYMYLLQRNTAEVGAMVDRTESLKNLSTFMTLISKAKSIFPGQDEQILYTEYENLVVDRREVLKGVS